MHSSKQVGNLHILKNMITKKAVKKEHVNQKDRRRYLSFSKAILKWNDCQNNRPMPWKGETDPYKIWLSEIMLQQTRVEQGWHYYLRFLKQYPSVRKLAAASDEAVFKLWEGLGYYSRCRNLLAAAREIMTAYGGEFPNDYHDIIKLKGVGPYTAAAIASFAFNLPYAVVDGNVIRILARYFGISTAFDSSIGKKEFADLAQQLLPMESPGVYNQSMMDFGATVCKPASPLCDQCPISKGCYAYLNGQVSLLPAKQKKLKKKHRWFYFATIFGPLGVLVNERKGNDVWRHLFNFPLLERADPGDYSHTWWEDWSKHHLGIKTICKSISPVYKQQLTHQTIQAVFIKFETKSKTNLHGFEWADKKRMASLPFPKIIRQYLDDAG
jgi:A/G-specific adenine glycosylase